MGHEVRSTLCPEWQEYGENEAKFFLNEFECPFRNNSFGFVYRFFRGIFMPDMEHDFDLISANLRHGSVDSCKQILGLGLHMQPLCSLTIGSLFMKAKKDWMIFYWPLRAWF